MKTFFFIFLKYQNENMLNRNFKISLHVLYLVSCFCLLNLAVNAGDIWETLSFQNEISISEIEENKKKIAKI